MSGSCDSMDCSLPDSSIHGIFQARILEWVAISFSRGFSRPRDRTPIFCIAGRFFTSEPTEKLPCLHLIYFHDMGCLSSLPVKPGSEPPDVAGKSVSGERAGPCVGHSGFLRCRLP